jgi:hypothetical protein
MFNVMKLFSSLLLKEPNMLECLPQEHTLEENSQKCSNKVRNRLIHKHWTWLERLAISNALAY